MKSNLFPKLLSVILSMFLIVSFASCSSKTAINNEIFTTSAENIGENVIDISEQYEDYPHIISCLGFEDENMHVEFFQIENKDKATGVFNSNKQIIESYKGSMSRTSSFSTSNFQKYSLTTNDTYYICERVENTVIYAEALASQANALDDFLASIGY